MIPMANLLSQTSGFTRLICNVIECRLSYDTIKLLYLMTFGSRIQIPTVNGYYRYDVHLD